jgi:hypothetical protein
MRKVIVLFVLLALMSRPANAQIPVTDAAALVQIIRIVSLTRDLITIMREEYQTVQRIGQGYGGNLLGFRIPAIPQLNHDAAKFEYAAALLEGLNSGDPYGDRYNSVVRPVMRPGALFEHLPPDARKVMEASFATIEIADSIATMGIHGSAQARGYAERIATLIQSLQRDVTTPGGGLHEVTAIADKLAIAGLINSRQNQSSAQIKSSQLELQLARTKAMRDAQAAQINMTITNLKDNGQSNEEIVGGADDALRNWHLR